MLLLSISFLWLLTFFYSVSSLKGISVSNLHFSPFINKSKIRRHKMRCVPQIPKPNSLQIYSTKYDHHNTDTNPSHVRLTVNHTCRACSRDVHFIVNNDSSTVISKRPLFKLWFADEYLIHSLYDDNDDDNVIDYYLWDYQIASIVKYGTVVLRMTIE